MNFLVPGLGDAGQSFGGRLTTWERSEQGGRKMKLYVFNETGIATNNSKFCW